MTRDEIQKFVDEDINPALESHGGFLLIHDFDEEKKLLKVQMGGGCQGCASARITLKLQIEGFLKEEFPKLLEIEDVTDHLAGTNPYY
jgi:Fe/S biogenesis protein NfuA|tara:strand:- start:6473 stop:6736 length:264 start_codon:yes stop_codon:yes gene_type:complete